MKRVKILAVIILICIYFNASYLDSVPGWLILLSQLLIITGLFLCYNKINDIFSPIVITYVGMLIPFSIKGMYILSLEKFPLEELVLPLIYYNIFVFFFTLALIPRNKNIYYNRYRVIASRTVNGSNLIMISLFLVTFSILIYGFKMGTLSPQELVSNVLGNRIEMQNSGGLYVQTLILLILQTALFINTILLLKTKRKKYFLSVTFLLVVNFLITFTLGGRGMIIVPILMLFFYRYKITGRTDWIKIIVISIAFLVFSGWYGMYRDGEVSEHDSILISDVLGNILNRYVQFDNFIRVVRDPVDYYFGQSFIDFLSSPIPRALYPDKPYNFNSQMTQVYHPEQAARFLVTDFTMLSELLLNFGVFGIVIGSIFFGRIISYFNYAYTNLASNDFFLFWYPFFMLKPMSYLYGGLINSTVNMMVILEVPIIFTLWLIYTKRTDSYGK
ncbi:oligosaccharide repeat unit polymerase [Vibrio vulnificus]|uniref:O-antigen polymerase n=1 Tax=Vibrio vulnificus TaxID=672 RepID=UPI001EE9D32C|nr:oligosaccharide repeat unit polymerase [Vibrio vulnificus]